MQDGRQSREGGDLIETYKILTGKLNVDPTQFFELRTSSSTRGHHLKIKKERCRLKMRAKFFSNRVVSAWNRLPSEVVSAKTTNEFKNKLDKYRSRPR